MLHIFTILPQNCLKRVGDFFQKAQRVPWSHYDVTRGPVMTTDGLAEYYFTRFLVVSVSLVHSFTYKWR